MQKAIDIVKPVCPHWHDHRQLRRFFRSLTGFGYIANGEAVLVVVNWVDPCKTKILVEKISD